MKELSGFSIITPTIRRSQIDTIIQNYINQDFETKELIIIINNDDIQISEYDRYLNKYPNISIFKLQQHITLGECLNFGVSKAKYEIIVKFDDDDYYSPYYLREVDNALKIKQCDIVGKCRIHCYIEDINELRMYSWGITNGYSNWIAGATICFKKSVFNKIKFRNISESEDKYFIEDCLKMNLKIYCTSSDNFIAYRDKELSNHTWKVTTEYLVKNTKAVKEKISYKESWEYVNKIN